MKIRSGYQNGKSFYARTVVTAPVDAGTGGATLESLRSCSLDELQLLSASLIELEDLLIY
jgi:hypothetical protein